MLSFSFNLQLNKTVKKQALIFLLLSFPVFPASAQQGKTASFIIAENPSELILFNKYQQRVSSELLKTFPAGTPFQILKDNEVLSDGYTNSIKIQFENNLYFIGKRENEKSKYRRYRNVPYFSDTIEVTVSNKLFFNPEDQSPSAVFLKKGSLLLRIFKDGQFCYTKKLTDGNQFGWIPSNSSYTSKFSHAKSGAEGNGGIPAFLLTTAEKKISDINGKIGKLYSIYNQKENRNLQAPNLKLETLAGKLVCSFSDINGMTAFTETQKYILNELEIVFLGSGYKISKTDIGFEISK